MSNPPMAKQRAYQAYRRLWEILDWLYPPRCGGCGQCGSRWCQACHSQSTLIEQNYCPRCGQIQSQPGLCSRCTSRTPVLTGMRSWALFDGPVRNALHRLKYARDIALGEVLSRPLIQLLKQLKWEVDCVLPVPLAQARQKQRGYNQAALLAYPLALATGIKYRSKGVKKIKETRSQVGLSIHQRHENVADAFLADPAIVKNCTVLIIDDVATSGATMESCASAIMIAGANQVYGMTLAQAPAPSTPVLSL